MVWKFLRSDVESIKSVGAVGAVFEEVFFRFGKFFAAFVFAETVAAAAYAGCLNGEDKVVVILSVEEWHKALLAGKTLVDEKIFLIVPQTKGTVLLVCWYAFVAISKQCVNAFEICQGHLPT